MNEHIAHSGAWGLAAIMIVVASWVFYRYFAPKNWREWAGAGVVQPVLRLPILTETQAMARHGRTSTASGIPPVGAD